VHVTDVALGWRTRRTWLWEESASCLEPSLTSPWTPSNNSRSVEIRSRVQGRRSWVLGVLTPENM